MKKFICKVGEKVFGFITNILGRMETRARTIKNWFLEKSYIYSDAHKVSKVIESQFNDTDHWDSNLHQVDDMEKYTFVKKGGCEVQTGSFKRGDCD